MPLRLDALHRRERIVDCASDDRREYPPGVLRAGRISVSIGAALLLTCCSQDDRGATPPSKSVGGASVEKDARAFDLPQPFVSPRDAPPDGVKRQISYFQQGGAPNCKDERATHTLTLSYGVDALPRAPSARLDEPRIGDLLAICVLGLVGREPVEVSIDAPDRDPAPIMTNGIGGSPSMAMAYLHLMPENGAGRWRFTARAGSRSAGMMLDIPTATEPGYRHVSSGEDRPGEPVEFVLVGFESGQSFKMHIYRPRERQLIADYVTTSRGRVRRDGTQTLRFSPKGAEDGCHIAKVEVEGQILDDRFNELSSFCPYLPEG